tara:strand:+ start:528 stop:1160 length:633 start_codon:yes stop_codon:yes gene_type:complete
MVSREIREIIRNAIRSEEKTHRLRSRLERQLPELHKTLVLPEREPVSALMIFITGYVKSVPSCLRLVTAVSKRLGFFDYAAPFLHLAEDYFFRPPDDLPHDDGLEALLDEAFLALRLLEEVNDHHIRHLGRPLLPLDMTEANIIVHHLLGDDLATRMEQLVQYTAERLLHREHMWEQVRNLPGRSEAARPIFSSDKLTEPAVNIRLRLAS